MSLVSMVRPARLRIAAVVGLLVLSALLVPHSAQAQTEKSFTLAPGGTATITFVAYCTEFGKFFPQQIQAPNGDVAIDTVRSALAYIADKGISSDGAKALDANFAIWQLAGFGRAVNTSADTQTVKDNAKTPPAAPSGATSMLDAAKAGKVTLTLASWAPIGDKVKILSASDNFYGRGTLTVANTSTEKLVLYMPAGTTFPGSETRFQTMGGYAEDVKVQNPTLPNTAAGDELPVAPLAAFGLVLIGIGLFVTRRVRV